QAIEDDDDDMPTARRTSTNISAFELPSASSWQSVESGADLRHASTTITNTTNSSMPLVEQNFRAKFAQAQRKLQASSTNLVDVSKVLRRTGSVVRFADEVDLPDGMKGMPPRARSPFRRAASEGNPDGSAWRPDLPHRDSIVSNAAASEDGIDPLSEKEGDVDLPRTKSQLSLAIAELKRSQSFTNTDDFHDTAASPFAAITSPQIEKEQEELISGRKSRALSKEGQNVLKMGRRDGVTRAGGVNMPKQLTVQRGKPFRAPVFSVPEESYL
ncbi:hypothetical protein LTR66_016799, partial [Elasticomyces elasticus]